MLYPLPFTLTTMFALHGNYVDLIILTVLALYVVEGVQRGFWAQVADLASFLGSLFIALRGYHVGARLLVDNFSLPNSFANALGFILVAFLAQTVLSFLVYEKVLPQLPGKLFRGSWTRIVAILPAALDASILIAVVLTLIVSLPISPRVKADVVNSKIGGFYIAQTNRVERQLADIFGEAVHETLNFLTVKPQSGERVNIPYKPQRLTVDEVSEGRMLELVNAERVKVGAKLLMVDSAIVVVARAHSRDMWERNYFSHVNPDGRGPFDRMKVGGVSFAVAGENIALAPTVGFAHNGLMNSSGHRRNILDPQFGRIGIGVIDGGIYGKMFTQNFAD